MLLNEEAVAVTVTLPVGNVVKVRMLEGRVVTRGELDCSSDAEIHADAVTEIN